MVNQSNGPLQKIKNNYMEHTTGETNTYALRNFKNNEDGTVDMQTIKFYELHENVSGFTNGTTVEEVLRIARTRLSDLNSKFASRQNALAITKIEEALHWLEDRTRERKERGVEGTHQA